jgi:hypothetical protein
MMNIELTSTRIHFNPVRVVNTNNACAGSVMLTLSKAKELLERNNSNQCYLKKEKRNG